MDKKVEIMEIKLKLGKKEATLTVEEAKKLKEVLDELFGKKIVKEEHHHHHDDWYPKWYWYDRSVPFYQPTWCGADTKYLCADNASQLLSPSISYTDNTLTCTM